MIDISATTDVQIHEHAAKSIWNMSDDPEERYTTEIELLQSMYAEQFHEQNREVTFNAGTGQLLLRIPHRYLRDALPEVITASFGHQDARDDLRRIVSSYSVGEEILDAIVLAFLDLESSSQPENHNEGDFESSPRTSSCSTVIIWLHHLLNTNKRKQCLSPDHAVSGLTKPGYPGVLIYSGPSQAVHDHVNELKRLNWAAFQVRLVLDAEWQFRHGKGMVEVETMKDVVTDVEEHNKDAFLESMRMK